MATYVMFGNYSADALKKMSPKRTEEAINLVKKYGGEVFSMYALLGEKDLLFITSFPGADEAMKASIALSKMSGIAFATYPAVPVEDFDKMTADL